MVYAVKNKLIFTEGSTQRHSLLTNIEKHVMLLKNICTEYSPQQQIFLKT